MSKRRLHRATEQEVEQAVYEALQAAARLVPVTPAEVARAEAELWQIAPDAAEAEPPAFHRVMGGGQQRLPRPARDALADPHAEDALAQAAREAGTLPPDIQEAMHRDRDAAEAEADDGEAP